MPCSGQKYRQLSENLELKPCPPYTIMFVWLLQKISCFCMHFSMRKASEIFTCKFHYSHYIYQPMEKCSKGALKLYYATFEVISVKMVLISEFYMYRKQGYSYFERYSNLAFWINKFAIFRAGNARNGFSIKFWPRKMCFTPKKVA